jgi:hypothetical protein
MSNGDPGGTPPLPDDDTSDDEDNDDDELATARRDVPLPLVVVTNDDTGEERSNALVDGVENAVTPRPPFVVLPMQE